MSKSYTLLAVLLFLAIPRLPAVGVTSPCLLSFAKEAGWPEVSAYAKLVGKELVFSHSRSPEKKFKLVFKAATDPEDPPNTYYGYIETVPSTAGELPQVVSLVTGLGAMPSGNGHVGWVIAVDHQKVLREVKKRQDKLPNLSRLKALKALRFSGNQQLALEAEILVQQLEAALGHKAVMPEISDREAKLLAKFNAKVEPEIPDAEVDAYFAANQKAPPGTTYAIVEQIAKAVPLNSKVEFDLANAETVEALANGTPWESTLLGRYTAKAGLELETLTPPSQKAWGRARLVKKRETPDFFRWE